MPDQKNSATPASQPAGDRLPVMEQFYTLQGEGCFSGRAAYFIRLSGCPVHCPWCDVKESWNIRPEQYRPLETILEEIPAQAPLAVITGGEPLLHPLDSLTRALHRRGLRTHLETSATRELSGQWDWICVSPKAALPPLDSVLHQADELKTVICTREDLERAEHYATHTKENCHLLLQPEWSRRDEVLPLLVAYVKRHPRWGLSLQTHKYIDIP